MALDDAMGFLSGTAFLNATGTAIADGSLVHCFQCRRGLVAGGLLPGRARFLVQPQRKINEKSPIRDCNENICLTLQH